MAQLNTFGAPTSTPVAAPSATDTTNQNQSAATGTAPSANPAAAPAGNSSQSTISPEQQAIIDQVSQSLGPTLKQTISAQLTPLQEQVAATSARLDQALAPGTAAPTATGLPAPANPSQQAQSLFGGTPNSPNVAPAQRIGQDAMGSQGFALFRCAQFAAETIGHEFCKLEYQSSVFLRDAMMQMGFTPAGTGRSTMIAPLTASYLPAQIVGDYRQKFGDPDEMMRQSIVGADKGMMLQRLREVRQGSSPEELLALNQALSMFDSSGLSSFLDPGPKGEIIGLLKSAEVLSRAGATNLPLPPHGHQKIPRQTGSTTTNWIGEAQTIPASEPTMGDLQLRAKKLGSRVLLPNELLLFGGPEVEQFVRSDMILEMAIAIDLAGLEGKGGNYTPLGLLNTDGIQKHTRSLGLLTNGDRFEPETVGAVIADLGERNFDVERESSFNWVMRPTGWHDNILQRRADAITAGDGKGQWLFDVASDVKGATPNRLRGKPVLLSTQVSNKRVKGSSTDLSYVLAGIFKELIIARIGVIEFATSVEGDTPFTTDQTGVRAIQHADVAARRPAGFVFCDKIDWDEK